jgi:SAM-dependent methyltransferase
MAWKVIKRVAHPGHLARAIKLQRGRKQRSRAFDDERLALLAQLLPSGFLHYGYFDDPNRAAEDISVRELTAAQRRYASLLLEHVHDKSSPVLDIGCGMGALSQMLREAGFSPVALTPDRLQAAYVRKTYPGIPVIESKFEEMPEPEESAGKYGTVITSESLQYLELERTLPQMARILKPGGTWVACDYFRIGAKHGRSGHEWNLFHERLDAAGWDITYERDITPHVLPTLRYIRMWGTQFGVPFLQFALVRLRARRPGLHYILQDALSMIDDVIEHNLRLVDPEVFAANKRYALLAMRKRA